MMSVPGWEFGQKRCMQGREIHIQSVFSHMNDTLPCPWWKWSNVINLPLDGRLLILGRGTILTQFCSHCWPTGRGLVSCGEWKSVLLNPCITIPAIMAALFLRPPDDDGVGRKRG